MAIGEVILILAAGILLYPLIVLFVWRLPLFFVNCLGSRPGRQQLLLAIKLARMTDWMVTNPVSRSCSPLLLCLQRLSNYLFENAEYDQCAAVDEERIELLEQAGDTVGLAEVMSNVSVHYMFSGQFDRAIELSDRTAVVIEHGYKASLKDGAADLEKIMSPVYAANFGLAMFNRAWILEVLRRFEQAEPIRVQILEVLEKQFGKDHFAVTPHLNRLGEVYRRTKRREQANELFLRCLQIREAEMRKGNPLVTDVILASSKQAVGELLLDTGQLDAAGVYLEEAAAIVKRECDADNPARAEVTLPLGRLRVLQHRYEEAESIILECVFAMEKKFGKENPLVLDALEDLLALQRATGKDAEAAQTAERITKMCERWQIVASV